MDELLGNLSKQEMEEAAREGWMVSENECRSTVVCSRPTLHLRGAPSGRGRGAT